MEFHIWTSSFYVPSKILTFFAVNLGDGTMAKTYIFIFFFHRYSAKLRATAEKITVIFS